MVDILETALKTFAIGIALTFGLGLIASYMGTFAAIGLLLIEVILLFVVIKNIPKEADTFQEFGLVFGLLMVFGFSIATLLPEYAMFVGWIAVETGGQLVSAFLITLVSLGIVGKYLK